MRRSIRLPLLVVPLACTLLSCQSSTEPAPTGELRIRVSTTGGDLDANNYRVILDGGAPRTLALSGGLEIRGLAVGSHQVTLEDVAANCDLAGPATRFVTVERGQTVELSFSIVCYATGVEVLLTTQGLDQPGSYILQVGSLTPVPIPVTGTLLQTRLVAGTYSVALSGLPPNCHHLAGPTDAVQVIDRRITRVTLSVQCVATTGVLEVFPATTGDDPDQNGYAIRLSNAGAMAANPNVVTRITSVGGTVTVQLDGVASNCTVQGPAVHQVELRAGGLVRDTVRVSFDILCARVEKLAYVENELVVVAYSDGSNPTFLANGVAVDWSPVGNSLVYHARFCPSSVSPSANWMDYPTAPPCVGQGLSIASQPPQPVVRQLTSHPSDHNPAWSPDGQLIAFDRQGVLRLVRANGSDDVSFPVPGVISASDPSWSPDGNRLVFTCQVSSENVDLCAINRDGSGFQRLTTDAAMDREPDWGPDGRIAFTTTRFSNSADVALLDPGTGTVIRVASGWLPAWSGDGSKLAFAVTGLGIAVVRPDGTGFQVISHQGGYAPAWRP